LTADTMALVLALRRAAGRSGLTAGVGAGAGVGGLEEETRGELMSGWGGNNSAALSSGYGAITPGEVNT